MTKSGASRVTAYNRSGDATMPKFLRNLAAAVLASGFACNPSCWAQQASNKELPLVWVLSTGGTIAGTGASTNTLEETAYFLSLTIKYERPVILVGSMRPSTAISADGPLNLLNAIRTAIAPEARRKGRTRRDE
jgi:L-asparaginase/Glu-tRNA(Gln) amidotransferase subunit D